MKRSMRTAALSALAVLVWASAARAAQVTYSFSGTIEGSIVVDYSGLNYVPSDLLTGTSTFVGTLSFDNAAPQALSGGRADGYRGSALNMSMSVTVDGKYVYELDTPSDGDEIDMDGNSFELFKRGPSVNTAFGVDPPFSHFEMEVNTNSLDLSQLTLSLGSGSGGGGLSDQQSDAGYYFIPLTINSLVETPEPGTVGVVGLGAAGLLMRRRGKLGRG